MSDLRGGTFADTFESLPDDRPTTPAERPATAGELFNASRIFARSDRSDAEQLRLHRGYAPIVQALGLDESQNPASFYDNTGNVRAPIMQRSTLQPDSGGGFMSQMIDRPRQEQLIAQAIRQRRAKDPGFLAGVPDTVAGVRNLFIDQEKKRRTEAAGTLSRSSGLVGALAGFAGGALETTLDPVNLATLPIGGGGKTVLGIAAREALLNGAIEALQAPIVASNRKTLGEDYTTSDFLESVGFAAAGGAALGTAGHVGANVAGRAYDATVRQVFEAMPASVQRRWANRMKVDDTPVADLYASLSDRDAARFARDIIGRDRLSPDEHAAVTVLERDAEIASRSPFKPTASGDGAYRGQLASTLDALLARQEPPAEPSIARGYAAASSAPTMPESRTVARGDVAGGAGLALGRDEAVSRFMAKTRRAESSGNDAARAATSSAAGRYQFTDGTWIGYHQRRYGGTKQDALAAKLDPVKQEALMRDLTADNAAALQRAGMPVNEGTLYLAHFLGSRDAVKVMRADPARGVDGLVDADSVAANRSILAGKSASQVVQWAQRKMGGDAAAVPHVAGFAIGGDVEGGDFKVAQLRGEALALQQQAIGGTPDGVPPSYTRAFRPNDLIVDAARFQFKSGGDEFGVSERLQSIDSWNPIHAGRVMVWEASDGRFFVADGHQRSGLARRLEAKHGVSIDLDALVLREADGVTAQDARVWAALKNIAEGTGTSLDAAKVLRDAGDDYLKHLPPRSPLVRDGAALARLSDEAFGAAYNGVLPADQAAVIGHLLPDDPDAHAGMVDLLVQTGPANRAQASSIVRQGIAAGFHKETQSELFGSREMVSSLFLQRAKVLERGLARLRKMKLVYSTAAREADTLERAGSTIAREASAKEAQDNAAAIEIVDRLAHSSGPVSNALNAAAGKLAAGGRLADVTGEFVAAVRGIDLRAAVQDAGADGGGGGVLDGAGRGSEAGTADGALPEERGDTGEPSLAELEDAGQVTMFAVDHAERFSDPVAGDGAKAQTESLTHDVEMAVAAQAAPEVAQLVRGQADQAQVLAGQRGAPLDDLLERARTNQNELAATADELARDLGVTFINPGAKDPASARRKMVDEGYADAGDMKDLARGAFLVDEPAQANKLLAALSDRFIVYDKGWQRLASGYVDRKIIVGFGNGGVAELQLVPRSIGEFKFGEGHASYERARSPATSAQEAERLIEHMRAGYERLLEGSAFEAIGNTRPKSAGESSTPSSSALRASEGRSDQAPPANTEALSPSTETGLSSSSNNRTDQSSLFADSGQIDASQASRQALAAQLAANSPLRARSADIDTAGTIGLGLFDASDQPRFRLDAEGGDRDAGDLLRELDDDDAAIATLQGCMVPGKMAA